MMGGREGGLPGRVAMIREICLGREAGRRRRGEIARDAGYIYVYVYAMYVKLKCEWSVKCADVSMKPKH
jgi:hypothetical protein